MAIYRFQITRKVDQWMDVAINADNEEEAKKMVSKILTDGSCDNVDITKNDIRDEMNKRLEKFEYTEDYELREPGYASFDEDEYAKDVAPGYVGTRGEELRLTYTPPVEDKFDVQVLIEEDPKEIPAPPAFNNLDGIKLHATATTKAYLELFGLNTQMYVKLKNFFLHDCDGHKVLFNPILTEGRHDPMNRTRAFVVNSTKLGEASRRELAKREAARAIADIGAVHDIQAGVLPTPIANRIKEQLFGALMGNPNVHIVDLRNIRG